MERTSIFTSSHKLISTEHAIGCPNCAVYETQMEKLKQGLVEKYKEIEIVKPVILNMLENQDMIIYEEELYKIKRNYEELRKKIFILSEQNESLLIENSTLKETNNKLSEEINSLKKHLEQNLEKETKCENNNKEKENKDEKSILSETSTNIMDKSLFGLTKNENKDILAFLYRRETIQEQRHLKINKLEQILAAI